jgi:predicted ester cyclase
VFSKKRGIAMSVATNKALVMNYVQIWNQRNPSNPNGLANVLHADFEDHDVTYPTSNPDIKGVAQFIQDFAEFLQACPNAHLTNGQGAEITAADMVAEGDKVVLHFTLTGTYNRGSVLGLSSAPREIQVRGMVLYRILEDRIRESWAHSDDLGMMRQI